MRQGAIIGFGFIAEKGHLPAYLSRTDFSVVAVADVCAPRRELARKLLPHARIYEDAQSLMRAERGLDFVDIATPPRDHAPIACAAMARGLHVLCEKPLATSVRDAESVLDAASKNRRVFFPVHNYKHAPSMRAVRDIIDSGRIGAVNLVTLDTFRTQHARGVAEWLPDWRRIRSYAGGGIAMDHGAHTFYLTFDWLGSHPLSITAKMSSQGAFDTEDNFTCTVTFPTGVAMARLTWNAAVRKVIYTIHGDAGAIRIEDDDVEISERGRVVERRSIASHWGDASHKEWFGAILDSFGSAIETGEFVGADARDAVLCIKLIETAYASSRSGCVEMSLSPGVHVANAVP
ncbi:MAG TPA: Gfo/Idh/MocA family oxidoreductase [Polyangia bacterium]|jgi:predicted dehydrogenase